MSGSGSRKSHERISFEDLLLGGLGLVMLIASIVAKLAEKHVMDARPRVQYGLAHLPGALFVSFLFCVLIAAARWMLTRNDRWRDLRTAYFVLAVAITFGMFWLPAVLAGGFDRDDWMLLGAASVRRMLIGHPALAWNTLDAVDGNFRPLGTVLYIGIMLRHFGVWARPFLLGLFAVNLLASLLAFAIVRSLGYSRFTATAGAILYLSRSETYTIVTWTCALGDALVILLCGLMALALLAAIRRRGWQSFALHLAAWACFCLATLAKQSAFAAPLIAGLLLYLRPGTTDNLPQLRRLWHACLAMGIYGVTAAVPFFHAKRLLASPSPYPIAFSSNALFRVFGYATWYVGTFEFPTKYESLQMLPNIVGCAVLCAVGVMLWRVPKLSGERPRDIIFCLLAAVASVSLFVVLPARVAPYYGSMAAFWASIALAIALTRFGWAQWDNHHARVCCLFFCMLVVVGFADVRLKQTGLLPAGGYTWGASEIGLERTVYDGIAQELTLAPHTETLLLEDMPDYDGYFAGMALAADPRLKRILTYHTGSAGFLANDRAGLIPLDDLASLRDARAYNWYVPMDHNEAETLLSRGSVLRLKFHDGKIESGN